MGTGAGNNPEQNGPGECLLECVDDETNYDTVKHQKTEINLVTKTDYIDRRQLNASC